MAKINDEKKKTGGNNPKKKRTSIGLSSTCRPKSKHGKKSHKKYRGQGRR